jgi:hypothetical protein
VTCDNYIQLPATNTARFHHLRNLAREAEREGNRRYGTALGKKYLKLAGAYWEMAYAAMPGADPEAKAALADKLRLMTVENGCTPAEAQSAAQIRLKLEGGQ